MVDCYFLIVNYNSSTLVKRLLESLPECDRDSYRVVIVNNSPEDRELLDLASNTIKIITATANLGFGRACNIGLQWISQQNQRAIVWLINPDTYFNLDSKNDTSPIKTAVSLLQKYPLISILGTTVYNSQGEITSAGGTFDPITANAKTINSLPANINQDYRETDWVSGCSLLINLANFQTVPQRRHPLDQTNTRYLFN